MRLGGFEGEVDVGEKQRARFDRAVNEAGLVFAEVREEFLLTRALDRTNAVRKSTVVTSAIDKQLSNDDFPRASSRTSDIVPGYDGCGAKLN